jgi:hypothetical protein
MTPIPAKVLTLEKQSSQYRVPIQIELDRYLGSFHTLRFEKANPGRRPVLEGDVAAILRTGIRGLLVPS